MQRYRDPTFGKEILAMVLPLAQKAFYVLGRAPVIMEVCGTHTAAFSRAGLRELLDGRVDLRSGPGCPVCVTDRAEIDCMIELSRLPRTVIGTFGDMLKVPGSKSSLEKERSRGATIKIFYSPMQAVDYAAANPKHELVFLGVGFETTAPAVALSIAKARGRGIKNYSVYSVHKIVPPIMRHLVEEMNTGLDGFILPGHLCAITGSAPFDFIARNYGVPAVVTGFEIVDLLSALYEILEMIVNGKPRVINGYSRVVREYGNGRAKEIIGRHFEPSTARWRGFGEVACSGLHIRRPFSSFNAISKFGIKGKQHETEDQDQCCCGDLLRGKITPPQCGLFGRGCSPESPVGPCMVSAEGACSAYYRYEKRAVYK